MTILHWVPQLQVQMPTTISLMGSYTSGNMFASSCLLLKNLIAILYGHLSLYVILLFMVRFPAVYDDKVCFKLSVLKLLWWQYSIKFFQQATASNCKDVPLIQRLTLFLCWDDDDDDVYRVSPWNFGISWHFDVAVCVIRFYWIVSSSSSPVPLLETVFVYCTCIYEWYSNYGP